MPRTNFRIFLVVAAAALATLLIVSSSTRALAADAAHKVNPAHLSSLDLDVTSKFHWRHSAHKPPTQRNSTRGSASWYSDLKWMNPFSGAITLDEDRALLPPLPERPYVYTYYDTTVKRDKATKEVDQELILTWRRAWWAKGFRPVVLTQADALANPHYRELGPKGVQKVLEFDFARWLAWSHMGTGLLADVYCIPMGPYDDELLSHLRRGQYAQLTKFDGLGSGLFAGEKAQIDSAIEQAFNDVRLGAFTSMTDAVPDSLFRVEQSASIAYYESGTVQKRYPAIANAIIHDPVAGRRELNKLMISHLHTIWQNTFSDGIEVLKPLPAHTTALIQPALHLAELLVECVESMLPTSCPPNKPRCSSCFGSRLPIIQPESYRNRSSLYTIATVPHPYTMITLNNLTTDISVSHIRRKAPRDAWIYSITRNILGDGRGGPSRLLAMKDAVASSYSRQRSLWFTVEHFPASMSLDATAVDYVPSNDVVSTAPAARDPFPENWLDQISWHFGFPIPRTVLSHGESISPVPLPGMDRWQKGSQGIPEEKKGSYAPPNPTTEQSRTESELLKIARATINDHKDKQLNKIRDVAEKWNLADLEAWKFVRAFRAQTELELEMFEKEEAAYESTMGPRQGRWW